ncbi:hypothetical protein C3L33_15660, partial [Rhododendron williamsianum]
MNVCFGGTVVAEVDDGLVVRWRGFQYGGQVVKNALIHFYGSTGLIGDARYLFDKMPHRDLASWNSLLAAYNSRFGDGIEALVLFREMMCVGIRADSITFVIIISALAVVTEAEYGSSIHGSVIKKGFDCYVNLENAMLGMYVKYGDMNAALTLFTEMGGRRDVVSHTILINGYIETGFIAGFSGYVESNHPNEALLLFEKMENEEVEPDEYTVVTILSTCACLSDLQYGRHCGSIVDAMATFYKMEEKDVFTWTTAIGGLANFGYVKESLELLNQMENEGVNPNEATFVSVLAACRQAGLVEEDHQADEFVKAMDPGERLVGYKTLLSACMNYSKIDLGLKVADELYGLGSEDHAVRVLLSNFYALAGEWSKVEEMRRDMKIFGMLKEPGLSCIGVTT